MDIIPFDPCNILSGSLGKNHLPCLPVCEKVKWLPTILSLRRGGALTATQMPISQHQALISRPFCFHRNVEDMPATSFRVRSFSVLPLLFTKRSLEKRCGQRGFLVAHPSSDEKQPQSHLMSFYWTLHLTLNWTPYKEWFSLYFYLIWLWAGRWYGCGEQGIMRTAMGIICQPSLDYSSWDTHLYISKLNLVFFSAYIANPLETLKFH